MLTKVLVILDRNSANIAHPSATSTSHFVTALTFEQRRLTTVAHPKQSLGHRFFSLLSDLGLIFFLKIFARNPSVIIIPLFLTKATGLFHTNRILAN